MGAEAVARSPRGAGSGLYVVNGAFGYSGECVTGRLLAAGRRVRTSTNSLRQVTPGGGGAVEQIPRGRGERKLPVVLSREELQRTTGAGRTRGSGGCACNCSSAMAIARSSCGSRPRARSLGVLSTSTSGCTPSFSTSHAPL